jgi:hypothetical protein
MADFTFEKPENWRYPQFSVEPPHIGGGRKGVDVSFGSFLCAKEKRRKKDN